MEIRTIEPRDFATVAQLENENWTKISTPVDMNSTVEQIMEKVLKGMQYFLAVDENSGEILGVLDCGPRHPHPRVSSGNHVMTFGVMTVEKARGKGIAQALILHLIDFVKSDGVKKLSIEALSTNPAALKLYEKLGFVQEGCQKAEFYLDGKYVDNLIYAYFIDEDLTK